MTSDASLSTELAVVVTRLDNIEAKIDKLVDDHEVRIRRLEAWSYAVPASFILAVGAAVAGVVR